MEEIVSMVNDFYKKKKKKKKMPRSCFLLLTMIDGAPCPRILTVHTDDENKHSDSMETHTHTHTG